MTKWNQQMLNDALEEALRDGMAVRVPHADDPADTAKLRLALYNRAKARGLHRDLEFIVEERHVIVRRKEHKGMQKVMKL